jgi:hypothetical protein
MDNAGNTGTAANGKANATTSGTPDANRSPTIGMGDFTPAAARRTTGVAQEVSPRGHSPPKDKGYDGPISGKVKQLHQPVGNSHSVK